MMGVTYSGNFYVVLDDAMPAGRMNAILTALNPAAMVVHRQHLELAGTLAFDGPRLCFQEAAAAAPAPETLAAIRRRMVTPIPSTLSSPPVPPAFPRGPWSATAA